jgi:DNA adenine methylase
MSGKIPNNILNITDNDQLKPFLRWAGGKRWFIKHLPLITKTLKYNNYHEPFLGSAAVYLSLNPKKKSYLSDLNTDLVSTYIAIRDNVELVIQELQKFKNTKDDYYKIRNSNYRSDFKNAAKFIYLNQTSFNGIYRVNLKGVYNVPFGNRQTNLYDPINLRKISDTLTNAIIEVSDFGVVSKRVRKNDLVFLDPPYTISHNQNGFIKYNQKLFSIEDQYRLSELIDLIKEKEAYYILTNAAHKKIEEIFDKGDKKIFLSRPSLIGGTNAIRGVFEEAVFTNIP